MLVVARFDRRDVVCHRLLGRSLIGQSANVAEPWHPRLLAELHSRWEQRRVIERAGGNVQMFAGGVIIEQRRSAYATKTARNGVGALEQRWFTPRPLKRLARNADQCREEIAHRLLAHPAMADVRTVKEAGGMIANRAALAAAGHWDVEAFHNSNSFCQRGSALATRTRNGQVSRALTPIDSTCSNTP